MLKRRTPYDAKRKGKEVVSSDESDTNDESNTDDDSNSSGSSDDDMMQMMAYDIQRFKENEVHKDRGEKKISPRSLQHQKERRG